ncbi:MAG: SufD family Fe-S cluster assembly protein [Synergistes jonesii]|uniref:SufB/SufD family protein n=1 Tax=Synergistes jonesii TaxID=2754 RepID=UPI002A74A7ED|nr:SufD family Fe-S cluster assembly protein [Synergistes jonesii]MDY2985511.1 SufD family Fe-S cluster assembly protein [Synergistes jonesii]
MKEYKVEEHIKDFSSEAPSHEEVKNLAALAAADRERLLRAGIDEEQKAAGTFVHADHSTVYCNSNLKGVEIAPISYALFKHDGLRDYYWKIMDRERDAFTELAAKRKEGGYFIRSEKGAKVNYPVQACMYLETNALAQDVHNVVIAEEGSELNIISGCASGPNVRSGLHVGVSEMYVKRGATLSFTMVHDWAEEMSVRPRTTVVVEEGGCYISNYICLKPAKDLQMYPTVYLNGENSVATFNTVLMAGPGSKMDTGSRVYLRGRGSRAEIVSRSVSTGGTVYARGHLIGEAAGVRAHLECNGLLLSDSGTIHAVPELEARHKDLEMSHEAAVGKINQEETEYLMARGLSEAKAQSLIVKGFLSLDILGLPDALRGDIEKIIEESTAAGAM